MKTAVLFSTFVVCLCACSSEIDTSDSAAAAAQSMQAPTHLGGCILLSPVSDRPQDIYQITDVITTNKYKPFTKILIANGLTLAARDDISDDFLRLVGRTIGEIFPRDASLDLNKQAEVIGYHYEYNAVIPVPKGEDFSFLEENEEVWTSLERQNSICDIIMQDVPGQVMEVVEHILHYVTDIGLHYAYPDEWGISDSSKLAVAMHEAVDNGYYDISQYDDIDDEEARNRVLLQEFAYWIVSTSWNLQEPYGPKGEREWLITDRDDLQAKLPDFYAVVEQTVDRIMVAPSATTLAEIGPTRAEE